MIQAVPTKPRKRVAIVENSGVKDLFEDSFAMSHRMKVGDKDVELKVNQRDDIFIEMGSEEVHTGKPI